MLGNRRGFTIIELLIVIIIIGILAAIAIPRYTETKRLTYLSSMKADLRTIVSAAEAHFSQDGTYANYPAPAGSNGATITFIGTADGWTATAQHVNVPGVSCLVERGPSAGTATEPTCQ